VPDDAFHRRTGNDAFGDGWNAEAEFHGVDLVAKEIQNLAKV
jgi:hypothetical protein